MSGCAMGGKHNKCMSKLFTWHTENICEHFQFVQVCVGVFLFTAYIINKLQDTSRGAPHALTGRL